MSRKRTRRANLSETRVLTGRQAHSRLEALSKLRADIVDQHEKRMKTFDEVEADIRSRCSHEIVDRVCRWCGRAE